MRILFTKSGLNAMKISEKLGDTFDLVFCDVIQTSTISVNFFNTNGYSLIFSSVNGVNSFFKNNFNICENFTHQHFNKIYCVGLNTKLALRKFGFGTFKLFKNGHELSQFIIENTRNEKFLHFCGNLALDIINKELPLQNINYKKIEVYTTQLLCPKITQEYDAIVFFSPSGVRSFAKNNSLGNQFIFSIGKVTTKAIENTLGKKAITSEQNQLDDLINLIKNTNFTS